MKKEKLLFITILCTLVYGVILSLQGFDLADEGWVLSLYQQIFNCPESVEYQFMFYFTGFIGGIWNYIFGFGGILSFRILNIITLVFTLYFTYLAVKNCIKPILIPIATLLVLLLLSDERWVVFHHNSLTALLVAVAVFFILKGLNTNKNSLLFFGALFCGVNIFARIPNVTMVALGGLLFLDYYYERNIKKLWKNLLYSLLGLFTGIGLVLLIMVFCGHLDVFKQSIVEDLFSVAIDNDSVHNFSYLMNCYINNYKNIYLSLSVFVFTTGFAAFIYRGLKNNRMKILLVISYSVLISYFIIYHLRSEKYYSVILFPLLLSCYIDRKNKSVMLLNIASLLIMFLLPLGTDNGVANIGTSCIWLATFVSVYHIYRYINYQIAYRKNYSYLVLFLAFYCLYVGYNLCVVSKFAFNDRGSRLEKCYRANNSKFTVFTTKEKAEIMDELLLALSNYVQKGDYLFCFESLPMIHYLTETKPYIGNSWVWAYGSGGFKKHLDKSVASIPLPVVLRQKSQPIGGHWTDPANGKIFEWLDKKDSVDYFERFIRENDYKVVWENELFVIYKL